MEHPSQKGVFKTNRKAKIIILITTAAILILAAAWLILWGGERTDVYIQDFTVEDNVMSVSTGVGSSMGYVRTCRTETRGDGLYLTFCSTFGPNCSLGAKNEFELELPEGCTKIYVHCSAYQDESGFRLVLEKDAETGEWKQAK